MRNRLYFAYGANMNRAVMLRRCPTSRPVSAMMLQNWQLEFYSHATIVPKNGAQCAGVLWNLTPECEQELDNFEGFPHYYGKRDWNQNGRQFFFYEMNHPLGGYPSEQYVNDIGRSYDQWRLPEKLFDSAIDRVYERYDQEYPEI